MIIHMIMNDSKRWRTFMKRLAYLRAEAAEMVESFEESISEIETRIDEKGGKTKDPGETDSANVPGIPVVNSRQIMKFTGKQSENNASSQAADPVLMQEDAKKEEDVDVVKKHYKRLWRVVAKMTHPDVAGNDEELVSLYKAAANAYEKDRREELLDVASEINAQLVDPHPEMFEDLGRRCLHYEQMIKKIRDSVAWQWKNAQENKKKEIIDLIKSKREETRKN